MKTKPHRTGARAKPAGKKASPKAPKVKQGENREFEEAQKKRASFDPGRWAAAMDHKKQMSRAFPIDHDPGPLVIRHLDLKRGVGFVPEGRAKVQVRKVKNPQPDGFGFAGEAFEVKTGDPHLKGTLVVRLNPKAVAGVGPETVRLFYWDAELKQFERLSRSGVGASSEYVWGRITRPGVYAPVGMPSHPFALQAVKLFAAAKDLMQAAPDRLRARLRDRLCRVILCAPDLAAALNDRGFVRDLERLGEMQGYPSPPDNWSRSPALRDLCQECLGTQSLPLPAQLDPPGSEAFGCTDTGWISVGPRNVSGCAMQVAVDPSVPDRIYAATADGGIWRLGSVRAYPAASRWTPLTDQQDTLSTTAVAVAKSDSRTVYYSDALGRLMRSDDRGTSWRPAGTTNLGTVRRILVHPSLSDVVFVATDSGFRRSIDAGTHWATLVPGDALDAAMDPEDPEVLFVGIRNEGVYRFDAGATGRWIKVLDWARAGAAPPNTMIKIALGARGTVATRAVAVRFADRVFVGGAAGRGYASRGTVSASQGDWDHVIAVDPFDDNVILSGGVQLFRSEDGGRRWDVVIPEYTPHEDQQGLAFDPVNRGVVYLANDGGVYRSIDSGATWAVTTPSYDRAREVREKRDLTDGLVTAQWSYVGVTRNRAVGSLYHSGVIATNALATTIWEPLEGHSFEFLPVISDPKRQDVFYYRFDTHVNRTFYPRAADVPGPHDITAAFPATIAPKCVAVDTRPGSGILLVGTGSPGMIMRTNDGDRRTFSGGAVSPPMAWAFEPGINLVDDAIVSIGMRGARAYAVSQSGRVFRKSDISSGGVWEERTNCGIIGVRELTVAAGTTAGESPLYVVNENGVGFSPDGGRSWDYRLGSDADTLPFSEFNSIVAHPADSESVYLGADIGVFISNDEGRHWHPFDDGLPNAQVNQIYWRYGWLYAATYGRGLWRRNPCR